MTSYNYKKPRTINWVTILLLLLVASGIYGAVKFGPPYWNRYKVEAILNEEKNVASDIPYLNPESKTILEGKVLAEVYKRVRAVPIEDTEEQAVEVGFAPDYSYLYAKWQVIVKHPFGKQTKLDFMRKATVPPRGVGL